MAWDGIIRVKLNRPLMEEEVASQLKVSVAASEHPNDNFSVFEKNETFLETANAQFHERGMLTYGGLFAVPLLAYAAFGILDMMLNVPDAVRKSGNLVAGLIGFGGLELCVLALLMAVLWGLHTELFTWTRLPIRFNRRTRMVHAYRGAGGNGIISVAWDKAFFFIESRGQGFISRTNTYNIRCHVLDERQYVVQSFSVGKSVASLRDELGQQGAQTVSTLANEFEYIRRYMEEGASMLPEPELVPTQVSLRNSMKIWLRTARRVMRSGNPVAVPVLVLIPFAALTGVLHYIGQLTSRQPAWPEVFSGNANSATSSLQRFDL